MLIRLKLIIAKILFGFNRNRVVQYAQAVKRTNTYTSAATTVRINTEWGEWSGEWGGVKAHSSIKNNGGLKGNGCKNLNGGASSLSPSTSYNKNSLLREVFDINIRPTSY